jgi:ferrous iron transport protein B
LANIKVALVGNPNTGKSTLFNLLTGLNQKIGNFPGITVDKKIGYCRLSDSKTAEIIDLPGTYSLYPKSKDESIVFQVLADKNNPSHPDIIVLVADSTNLRRNLLLCSQVADLGLPMLLVLNMTDLARKEGIHINVNKLSERMGIQVVAMSARKNDGLDTLKNALSNTTNISTQVTGIDVNIFAPEAIAAVKERLKTDNDYFALQVLHQHEHLTYFTPQEQQDIEEIETVHHFESSKIQGAETIARYRYLSTVLTDLILDTGAEKKFKVTDRLDKILTHRF